MDSIKIMNLKLVIDVIWIFVKLVKKKATTVLVVLWDYTLLMVFVLKNVLSVLMEIKKLENVFLV